jgi:hypothetical protein
VSCAVRIGPGGLTVDEAYVKAAGNWAYLSRAVDSARGAIEFMLWPERDLVWSGKSNERLRRADAGNRERESAFETGLRSDRVSVIAGNGRLA